MRCYVLSHVRRLGSLPQFSASAHSVHHPIRLLRNASLSRNVSESFRLSASSSLSSSSCCYYSTTTAVRTIAHSEALLAMDQDAVVDLFTQYAQRRNGDVLCLDREDLAKLRAGIGETDEHDNQAVCRLFQVADLDGNGYIELDEFLEHAPTFLGNNPARIILVVGGPGSGKGSLCRRLVEECSVVHLSSGDLLREEVERQTPLGKQVQDIMARGELVSSATIVALMKKRMHAHPGKRVLLDGFPRSLQNALDLVALCGRPELALHLVCDDTIMMERIMARAESSSVRRDDDNFQTALRRIRTYHKFHHTIMEWLHEQHVPVVNLDCAGSPQAVWNQLLAIGKLMRPAVKHKVGTSSSSGIININNNPVSVTSTDSSNEAAGLF